MKYEDLLYNELRFEQLDLNKPVKAIKTTRISNLIGNILHESQLWNTYIYTDGKLKKYGNENAKKNENKTYQSKELFIKDCSYIVVYQCWNPKPLSKSIITFYLKNPKNIFERRKIKKLLLNNKYNVININYSPIDEVVNNINECEKKTNVSNAMEELESSLIRLKAVAPNEYEILNQEYQNILQSNHELLTINPLSLVTIIAIQNKVDAIYNQNGGEIKRIIDILEKKNNEMIDNLRNDIVCNSSIEELDNKIDQLFKEHNNIDNNTRNKLLNILSQTYFLYLYANNESIDVSKLKYSFMDNNIKRIQVIISLLENNGIITNVPYDLLDINDIEGLINAIKTIKFIPMEEEKVIIKSMKQK